MAEVSLRQIMHEPRHAQKGGRWLDPRDDYAFPAPGSPSTLEKMALKQDPEDTQDLERGSSEEERKREDRRWVWDR